MKFGFDQLLEHTPLHLAKLGHALIGCTAILSSATMHVNPTLAVVTQVAGTVGYFLLNMFGDEHK